MCENDFKNVYSNLIYTWGKYIKIYTLRTQLHFTFLVI